MKIANCSSSFQLLPYLNRNYIASMSHRKRSIVCVCTLKVITTLSNQSAGYLLIRIHYYYFFLHYIVVLSCVIQLMINYSLASARFLTLRYRILTLSLIFILIFHNFHFIPVPFLIMEITFYKYMSHK